mgnify:CR=1 FL=1
MAQLIRIKDIAQYDGQEVVLQGWVYNRTDKGKLQFLQVRDGTGIAQCVVFQKDVSEAVFQAAASLTQESSLLLSGVVRADQRAPGVPGGFEIGYHLVDPGQRKHVLMSQAVRMAVHYLFSHHKINRLGDCADHVARARKPSFLERLWSLGA